MYRRVPRRIVIAHFNNKLIAYVNAGIRPRPASLPLVSRKKIRHRNSSKSRHEREEGNLRHVSDEKERRIAFVKDKPGKKPVPRHEKHEQEADCGTNRHPQRPAASIVPVIRAADHKRCQKQHRKAYPGYTAEFHATSSSCEATKILLEQCR